MKKQLILTVFAMLLSVGCIGQKSIYDFTVMDINGEEMSLDKYKGNVLLIVNVASKCGLTPQYKGLEELYREFKEQGLEILAFPCNQFLEQEPGSNDEILEFCTVNYDITFESSDPGHPEPITYAGNSGSVLLRSATQQDGTTPAGITAWEPGHHYIYKIRAGFERIEFEEVVVSTDDWSVGNNNISVPE